MVEKVESSAPPFIVVKEGSGPYLIRGVGGGVTPASFDGIWVSHATAQKAIDMYVEVRDKPKRTYRRDNKKPVGGALVKSKD